MNDQSGDAPPSSPSASSSRPTTRFPALWLVESEHDAATPLSDWEPADAWTFPAREVPAAAAPPLAKSLDHQQILQGMARVVASAGEAVFETTRLSAVAAERVAPPAAAPPSERPLPFVTLGKDRTSSSPAPALADIPPSSRFILHDEEAVSRRIVDLRRSSPQLDEQAQLSLPSQGRPKLLPLALLGGAVLAIALTLVLAFVGTRVFAVHGDERRGAVIALPTRLVPVAPREAQAPPPPLAVEAPVRERPAPPLVESARAPAEPNSHRQAPSPVPAPSKGLIVRDAPF